MNMEHGHMAARLLRIVGIVRPCVNLRRFRMTVKLENFYDAFPYRFPLKCLFHWHALDVLRFDAMPPSNHIPQFFNVIQAAASIKSPTLQKSRAIPAAIAGVHRSVLCRLTKL